MKQVLSKIAIQTAQFCLLVMGFIGLYTTTCLAQVKTKFRQVKTVKLTPLVTESSFTIQGATSAEAFGAGINTGGKMVVSKNPATGFKEIIEHGFVRGVGADVQFTGSSRGENGALPGSIKGTFKVGSNNLVIEGNVNGEWKNATYTYDGTNVNIKVIGNANGTIQTGTTIKYSTAVTNNSSYSGGITLNTNGSAITSLTAAANYNYQPLPTGGYGFTFTASDTYSFAGGDQTFWLIFGFNF